MVFLKTPGVITGPILSGVSQIVGSAVVNNQQNVWLFKLKKKPKLLNQ